MLKYFFRHDLSLNNFKNLQNYSKSVSIMIVSIMVFSLIISIFIPNVHAAPKDPRYKIDSDCDTVYDKKQKKYMETCCWRERVPGQLLANTYCQTCEEYTNNCGDKVLQMPHIEQNKPTKPLLNNDIVTENPPQLQPSSPTSDKGVIVREPLQPQETNDNGNEVAESLSRDSQSNSDGVGDTLREQKSDASVNSEELTKSNSNLNDNEVVEDESSP